MKEKHERILLVFAAALCMIGSAVAVMLIVIVQTTPPSPTTQQFIPKEPCASDDGPGPCFWDAGVRDNQGGHSFWINEEGEVTYLDNRKN